MLTLVPTTSDFSQSFPNVQYLGAGYDLLSVDPTAYGDSTSLRNSPISLTLGPNSPDGAHIIPFGVSFRPGSFSVNEMQGELVWSTSKLQNRFRVEVEAEVGIEGVAGFTASSFYQRVSTDVASSRNFHYIEHHVKTLYTLAMDFTFVQDGNESRQSLDPTFGFLVGNLPLDGSDSAYQDLINRYGTHIAKEVTYGGNFFVDLTISTNSYERSQSDEVGFKFGASGVAEGLKLGGSVGVEQGQSSANSSGIEITNQVVRAGGGNAVDAGFSEWAQDFQQNLIPVYVRFASLSALLTEDFFPSDPDIGAKQTLLRQCIGARLQSRQLSQDAIDGIARYTVKASELVRVDGPPGNDLGGTSWNLTLRGINTNGSFGTAYSLQGQCGDQEFVLSKALNNTYKLVGNYGSLAVEGIITDPGARGATFISDPTPPNQRFNLLSLQPGGGDSFQVVFWENIGNFHTRLDLWIERAV